MKTKGLFSKVAKCRTARVLRPVKLLTALLPSGDVKRLWRCKSGATIIIASFGIPVLLVSAGAAISFSKGVATKTEMQVAIDAAVLAGASEEQTDQRIPSASRAFWANIAPKTIATTPDINPSFSAIDATVFGEATGTASLPFADLIGGRLFPITVRSSAKRESTPICVLGLNDFDKGSFDINGNPEFSATCAVHANTKNNSGMTQEGNSPVSAKAFGVSGQHKTRNFSPSPREGATAVPDPFASLPFPPYSACSEVKKSLDVSTAMDLSPGTYCGGLTISGANVRLRSGLYIMVGGPLLVKGGAAVSGDGVLVGFTGSDSTLRLWGNSSLTLTSPASGTYVNMQFMVDVKSNDTHQAWVSIGGAGGIPDGTPKLSYDGVAYFGKQNLWIFGSPIVNANSPGLAMVADKIWVQGSASVKITNDNPRNLNVPMPPQISSGSRLLN